MVNFECEYEPAWELVSTEPSDQAGFPRSRDARTYDIPLNGSWFALLRFQETINNHIDEYNNVYLGTRFD